MHRFKGSLLQILLLFWKEVSLKQEICGTHVGYQGTDIWYPKLKSGIIRIPGYRESQTLHPPVSNFR